MAKELPYFKFFISEWILGDITLCSMEAQGVFTNIMVHYWNKNCSMSLAIAKQRFSKHESSIEELIFQNIIKLDEDDNIIINFLDEQMNEFINVSEKRAIAGKKGGKANAKHMLSKTKAKTIYKEKRKIREEKDKINIPEFEEFKMYVLENEPNINLRDLELKYKSWMANNWRDGNNKPIKNWKSKILNTIPYIKKNETNKSSDENSEFKTDLINKVEANSNRS